MAVRTSQELRVKRHRRIRRRITGNPSRPRLSVFRSNMHIYAQVIDDVQGHTLVSASTKDKEARESLNGQRKLDQARMVGTLVAERALRAGITQVVFDRGGFTYHGRVRAVADAAREAGLKF